MFDTRRRSGQQIEHKISREQRTPHLNRSRFHFPCASHWCVCAEPAVRQPRAWETHQLPKPDSRRGILALKVDQQACNGRKQRSTLRKVPFRSAGPRGSISRLASLGKPLHGIAACSFACMSADLRHSRVTCVSPPVLPPCHPVTPRCVAPCPPPC